MPKRVDTLQKKSRRASNVKKKKKKKMRRIAIDKFEKVWLNFSICYLC